MTKKKNNKQNQGLVFKTKFGIVPHLTVEEMVQLVKLVERNYREPDKGLDVQHVMWIGQSPIKGSLGEIAQVIFQMATKTGVSKPSLDDGWQSLQFKRSQSGKIIVKLPERDEPHFTFEADVLLPTFMIGMFAVMFKKLGMTQQEIDLKFGKKPKEPPNMGHMVGEVPFDLFETQDAPLEETTLSFIKDGG